MIFRKSRIVFGQAFVCLSAYQSMHRKYDGLLCMSSSVVVSSVLSGLKSVFGTASGLLDPADVSICLSLRE